MGFLSPEAGHSAYHADDVWVDGLDEDTPGAPHTFHQFIEGRTLHLLPLEVSHTVQEVKHHPTLGQFPAQQLMQLRGWYIWERKQETEPGPSPLALQIGADLLIPQAGFHTGYQGTATKQF